MPELDRGTGRLHRARDRQRGRPALRDALHGVRRRQLQWWRGRRCPARRLGRAAPLPASSYTCSNRVMGVRRPDWWCYPERCQNGHEWVVKGQGCQALTVILTRLVAGTAGAASSAAGVAAPYFTKCRGTTRSVAGYLLNSSLPHTGQVSARKLILRGPPVPEHSIWRRVMRHPPACPGQVRALPLSFRLRQIHCPVTLRSCDMHGYRPAELSRFSGAGHLAVFCNAAPGCRSVWYRPRHELAGQRYVARRRIKQPGQADLLCCRTARVSVGPLQAAGVGVPLPTLRSCRSR